MTFPLNSPLPLTPFPMGPPWTLSRSASFIHLIITVLTNMYHLDNLAFPTTNDDLPHLVQLHNGFWRNRWNKYFTPPPPQPVTPLLDPTGPPQDLSWISLILHLRRYLHTYNLSILLDLEMMIFEINTVLALTGPLDPHGDHVHHLKTDGNSSPWAKMETRIVSEISSLSRNF